MVRRAAAVLVVFLAFVALATGCTTAPAIQATAFIRLGGGRDDAALPSVPPALAAGLVSLGLTWYLPLPRLNAR